MTNAKLKVLSPKGVFTGKFFSHRHRFNDYGKQPPCAPKGAVDYKKILYPDRARFIFDCQHELMDVGDMFFTTLMYSNTTIMDGTSVVLSTKSSEQDEYAEHGFCVVAFPMAVKEVYVVPMHTPNMEDVYELMEKNGYTRHFNVPYEHTNEYSFDILYFNTSWTLSMVRLYINEWSVRAKSMKTYPLIYCSKDENSIFNASWDLSRYPFKTIDEVYELMDRIRGLVSKLEGVSEVSFDADTGNSSIIISHTTSNSKVMSRVESVCKIFQLHTPNHIDYLRSRESYKYEAEQTYALLSSE